MISTALICLANCDNSTVMKYIPRRLLFILPKIIRGPPSVIDGVTSSSDDLAIDDNANDRLFQYQFDIALLMERLVMLLTFGLATPYIAFICGLSAVMIWLRILFTMFVYVDKRDAWEEVSVIGRLNASAEGVQYFNLHTVWAMVGFVSCLYIGLVATDISLDSSNLSWYLAVLFVALPISLCVVLWIYTVYVSGPESNYKADGGDDCEPSLSESTPGRNTFEISKKT